LTFEKVTETVLPIVYRNDRLIQRAEVFVAVPKQEPVQSPAEPISQETVNTSEMSDLNTDVIGNKACHSDRVECADRESDPGPTIEEAKVQSSEEAATSQDIDSGPKAETNDQTEVISDKENVDTLNSGDSKPTQRGKRNRKKSNKKQRNQPKKKNNIDRKGL